MFPFQRRFTDQLYRNSNFVFSKLLTYLPYYGHFTKACHFKHCTNAACRETPLERPHWLTLPQRLVSAHTYTLSLQYRTHIYAAADDNRFWSSAQPDGTGLHLEWILMDKSETFVWSHPNSRQSRVKTLQEHFFVDYRDGPETPLDSTGFIINWEMFMRDTREMYDLKCVLTACVRRWVC